MAQGERLLEGLDQARSDLGDGRDVVAVDGQAQTTKGLEGTLATPARRWYPAAPAPLPQPPAGHAMSIVTFNNVEKSFAGRRLFTTVSFSIDGHDHAVLVGRNGAGKTTLLRLITGDEPADSGTIARARGRRIWLHEQTPELARDRIVREYLLEAFGEAVDLEAALRATEERLSGLAEHSPELRDTMRSYQQLQRRFEAAGGYGYRDRLGGVCDGLGLPDDMLERRLLSLSGGELTRVTLARALLADADLLLLDEPTNHLDIDSVEWLEAFLLEYERAFLLVTHDRRLLEKVGRRVLAVEHEHVETQGGDFSTYLRESEARLDLMRREYEQDIEKIEQLQRFYDRFHAKKDKAKQAKAKLTQIERIKAGLREPPRHKRSFKLGLPQPKPSARVVLELKAPAISVGSVDDEGGALTLVRDADVVLERGEKVALLGPNGSGKTTLIETVAGLRSLPAGASHLGHNVRPAYYSQQGRELREEDTVLLSVLPLVGHDEEAARRLLGRFQFGPDEVEKKVAMLSGGERSRLRLLTLLVGDANFLLLDEPTNHLDMGSVEALADALEDYTGTILLITHDRYLIDRVASRVLEIHDGRLLNHLSAARYWETRGERAGDGATAAPETDRGRGTGRPAPAGAAATRGRESAEEARRRRARLRGAEAAILRAEKRLGEIDAELAEPETYADRDVLDRLLDERGIVEAQLQREYAAWEKLVEETT
jgi:ATP-binding cassette subfamily F protein 3